MTKINLAYKLTNKINENIYWDLNKHRSINIIAHSGNGKTYLLNHILRQVDLERTPVYLLTTQYGDDLDKSIPLTGRYTDLTIDTLLETLNDFILKDTTNTIFVIQRLLYCNPEQDKDKLDTLDDLLYKLSKSNYILASHRPCKTLTPFIWEFDVHLLDIEMAHHHGSGFRISYEDYKQLKDTFYSLSRTLETRKGVFIYLDENEKDIVQVPDKDREVKEEPKSVYFSNIKALYIVKPFLWWADFYKYTEDCPNGFILNEPILFEDVMVKTIHKQIGKYFVRLQNDKFIKIPKEHITHYKELLKQRFSDKYIEK